MPGFSSEQKSQQSGISCKSCKLARKYYFLKYLITHLKYYMYFIKNRERKENHLFLSLKCSYGIIYFYRGFKECGLVMSLITDILSFTK